MPIFRLSKQLVFPDPCLADEEGLIAIEGDLSPERLILAYKSGIFPWYSEGEPILWFSPDPRMLLLPGNFKLSKSLSRTLKSGKFELRENTAFREVIQNCSQTPRKDQDGTWIVDAMIEAYSNLHDMGHARSLETYLDGKLVGGLYGIQIGKAFFGESMYQHCTDASKFAFYHLHQKMLKEDWHFIDCQLPNPHLKSLGCTETSRIHFLDMLDTSQNHSPGN